MKELKVGDKVRLRGHANFEGESLVVENMLAEVLCVSTLGRFRVRLIRNPYCSHEVDVFPSQCRHVNVKQKKKVWFSKVQLTTWFAGKWNRQEMGSPEPRPCKVNIWADGVEFVQVKVKKPKLAIEVKGERRE